MTRFEDLTLATTAHNNAKISVEMLRSFEANLGRAEEIVVVDDGSKEPYTAPVLSAPLRVMRNESALGFCKASDLALREVRTKYALLADADILFEPGDFAGGYAEFRKGNWAWVNFRQISFQGVPQDAYEEPMVPPLLFVAGNQAFMLWEKFQRGPAEPSAEHRIVDVEAVHSSCTLVDMAAFRAVGGFDPWYWQCQSDIDLSLRLRQNRYRVGIDFGYRVKHDGAGGKSGGPARVLDLYRSRVHLYEKLQPASPFYLRPLLFVRHVFELGWFGLVALFKKEPRLKLRLEMLKGVLKGYH